MPSRLLRMPSKLLRMPSKLLRMPSKLLRIPTVCLVSPKCQEVCLVEPGYSYFAQEELVNRLEQELDGFSAFLEDCKTAVHSLQ